MSGLLTDWGRRQIAKPISDFNKGVSYCIDHENIYFGRKVEKYQCCNYVLSRFKLIQPVSMKINYLCRTFYVTNNLRQFTGAIKKMNIESTLGLFGQILGIFMEKW